MRRYLNFILLVIVTTFSLVIFSGCFGSAPSSSAGNVAVGAQEEEALMTFEASEAVGDLEKRIARMQKDNMAFYVPNTYVQIKENYKELSTYSSNESKKEKVFNEVNRIDKMIDNAYKRKDLVNKNMSVTLNHFSTLKSLKSNIHYPGRFADLREDMLEIISEFDNVGGMFSGAEVNLEAFRDAKELSQDMLRLEIDTVLKSEYIPSKIALNKMEDSDFNDFAPVTFRSVQSKLLELNRYIRSNHLNSEGIAKKKESVLFELDHLSHVSKEVNYLIMEDNYEKIILNQEKKYLNLMSKLDMGDKRNKALRTQYELLLAAIDDVKASSKSSDSEKIKKIESLKKELKISQDESALLKEEVKLGKSNAAELNMIIEAVKMETSAANKEIEKLNLDAKNKEKEKLNLDAKNKEKEKLGLAAASVELFEANKKTDEANKIIEGLNLKIANMKKVDASNQKKAKENLKVQKRKTNTANKEIKKLNQKISQMKDKTKELSSDLEKETEKSNLKSAEIKK